MKSVRVERWFTTICLLKPEFTLFFVSYLCVTWVPRKLDMVSSKFCRRSAMFLTVRNRLVSGSSPEGHERSTELRNVQPHNHRALCTEEKIQRTWKVLDGELAGLCEGNVSTGSYWAGLRVHCPLAVCLGSGGKKKTKQIVQGSARGWILSILNYCAFSGNLIFGKLSRKRDKPD